jgi:hypothetical protein
VRSTTRLRVAVVFFTLVSACGGEPPQFAVELEHARPVSQERSRSLSIGTVAASPPGEYRFLRMHMDGDVELRELQTFNGPGPWRAYVGMVLVSSSVAREALASIDATPPESAPADTRVPCVIAFVDATGDEWQGCAYPRIAAQVLSQVPRLTPPEISPECHRGACQVRLLREVPALRHQSTGGTLQDLVMDRGGTVWCASRDAEQQGQVVTLRVERARIPSRQADRVFHWLTRAVEPGAGEDQSQAMRDLVMIRGRDASWAPLSSSQAKTIRARWQRLEDRLPPRCRLPQ